MPSQLYYNASVVSLFFIFIILYLSLCIFILLVFYFYILLIFYECNFTEGRYHFLLPLGWW